MLPIKLSRQEQSRAHLLFLRGLNTKDEPSTPIDAAKHAFAEICSMHLYRAEHSLTDIFQLAEKVLWHRDDRYPHCSVIFDVESLCESASVSREVAIFAVRLCGARLIKGRWADAEEARRKLTFESMQ